MKKNNNYHERIVLGISSMTQHAMKYSFVLLLCILINNGTMAQSKPPTFTLKLEKVDFEQVIKKVQDKSNFTFLYNHEEISKLGKVSVDVENGSIEDVLTQALAGSKLGFKIQRDIIIISPKVDAPQLPVEIKGKITDKDGLPLPGATVLIKGTFNGTTTDADGNYAIKVPSGTILVFSFVGFQKQEVVVSPENIEINVAMQEATTDLGEVEIVFNTGYQEIPKERATGSFAIINNNLLNRSTGMDIIERLENITPGLLFDRRFLGSPTFSIRGLSTIQSDASPLIIVDNFPYEGDINNINPNDIESVTVLRDAAAASIWGVRAGNGVIVITTKKGRLEQPVTVQVNSNITIGDKPDLYYDKGFLNSSNFIDVERSLFEQNYYDWMQGEASYPSSPVVQLLFDQRDGLISSEEVERTIALYKKQDIRGDISKYLYRTSFNQQHSVSLRGGGSQVSYYLSGGFDKNRSNLKKNGYDRVTVNSMLAYHPLPSLEISSNLFFSKTNDKTNNNSGMSGINCGGGNAVYPYARLVDNEGNPVSIIKDYSTEFVNQAEENGLLNWTYVPLNELANKDYTIKTNNIRINSAIKYNVNPDLRVEARYQYETQNTNTRNLQNQELYYTRNLINQFAYEEDGQMVFPVPIGDILDLSYSSLISNAGRVQANYNKEWKNVHQLNALVGAEVRQVRVTGSSSRFYGYDDHLLTYSDIDPTTSFIISPSGYSSKISTGSSLSDLIDRNVSYFGNASYIYKDRYMVSASARKDKSNLFGVDANQKGVPLWSVGLGWRLSSEAFYPFSNWLPMLKLKATYGYSGNVNKSLTAYPTAGYRRSSVTDLLYLQIQTPPNPNLRWEKVKMINIGIDFESKNHFLSGSIEYYQKKGIDLIGRAPLDPTIGFNLAGRNEFIGNNASLKGHGLDIQLNLKKSISKIINWTTQVLYSYNTDEVTRYDYESTSTSSYFTSVPVPIVGQPRYTINSVKWAGLDPATGDPQIYLDGEITKEYSTLFSKMTMDDIKINGSALPTHFGSIRNNFRIGDLTIGFTISYKLGYYFRRTSINYAGLYNNWTGHEDYTKRWQSPGDDSYTQVPSAPAAGTTSMRDWAYQYSDYLVEKGDHIRLQDINLSYEFLSSQHKWLPFKKIKVYGYINNIGILWRANKHHIDPDYIYQSYPASRTYSFGINVEF